MNKPDAFSLSFAIDPQLMREGCVTIARSANASRSKLRRFGMPFLAGLLTYLAVSFVAAVWTGETGQSSDRVIVGPALLFGILIGFLVCVIIRRLAMRSLLTDAVASPIYSVQTRATCDETGLHLISDVAERMFRWAAVDDVRFGRHGLYFRIGLEMAAIPRSALPADLTAEEALKRINLWREAAQ